MKRSHQCVRAVGSTAVGGIVRAPCEVRGQLERRAPAQDLTSKEPPPARLAVTRVVRLSMGHAAIFHRGYPPRKFAVSRRPEGTRRRRTPRKNLSRKSLPAPYARLAPGALRSEWTGDASHGRCDTPARAGAVVRRAPPAGHVPVPADASVAVSASGRFLPGPGVTSRTTAHAATFLHSVTNRHSVVRPGAGRSLPIRHGDASLASCGRPRTQAHWSTRSSMYTLPSPRLFSRSTETTLSGTSPNVNESGVQRRDVVRLHPATTEFPLAS